MNIWPGGKPVVATAIPELEEMGGLITVAEDAEGFERSIIQAIEQDSEDLICSRLDWAREQDWDARADLIAGIIASHYPAIAVLCDAERTGTAELDLLSRYRGPIRFMGPAECQGSTGIRTEIAAIADIGPGWGRRLVRAYLAKDRSVNPVSPGRAACASAIAAGRG